MRGIITKKGAQNIGPSATMARASVRSWQGGTLPVNVLARPAGSCGRGVFVEEGTTNLFTAPEAAGTLPATKTLAIGTYAVSAYGGGSIDVTGAVATACAGPDGANCKTFTLAAQTDITFAANGVVSKAQMEAKAYSTTHQDPALGARSAETLTFPTYVPATARELAECAYGVNLLTANQADGGDTLSSVSGWTAPKPGIEITTTTAEHYHGNRSIQITTPGAGTLEGAYTSLNRPVSQIGQVYKATGWVKAPAGAVMLLYGFGAGFGTEFTGTGDWQYVSGTKVATVSAEITVAIYTKTTQAITFYVDQLSLERVPAADSLPGSWVPGQQKRLLDATRSTITLDVLINSTAQRRGGQYVIRITDKIALYHATDSENWILSTKNDAGVASAVTIADALIPVGWRKLALSWAAASAILTVDGTAVATINNPNLPSAFPALVGIGCSPDGTGQLGTAIDNIGLYSAVTAIPGKAGVIPPAVNCVARRTFDAAQQVTRIGGRR